MVSTPSAPTPRWRSHRRTARSAVMSGPSTTTKSLPSPWYFQNRSGTRRILVHRAESSDGPPEDGGGPLQLRYRHELAGPVGHADIARPEDARLGPQGQELGELGAEGDGRGAVPALLLQEAHHRRLRGSHAGRVHAHGRALHA